MKKILSLLIAVAFLSGCALTTIKPYKKPVKREPEPVKKTVAEKVKEAFKPAPVEKEKVLPLKEEKEKILPFEEEIK